MPIPYLQPSVSVSVLTSAEAAPAPIASRFAAHLVDFCSVLGAATWLAKVSTVVLLSMHSRGLTGGARRAHFLAAYDYSVGLMMVGSLGLFATLYFVALPLLFRRTPGMALFGLRFRAPPSPRQLAYRLLGCVASYWIVPSLPGLIDGNFPADRLSGTQIVKD